jgi:hypothetical protein
MPRQPESAWTDAWRHGMDGASPRMAMPVLRRAAGMRNVKARTILINAD